MTSAPGDLDCPAGTECSVNVEGFEFAESFVAVLAPGHLFTGWWLGHRGLCGGSLEPCSLDASLAVDSPALTALVESDEEFLLKAQLPPDYQVRRYAAGDVIRLEGMLTESMGTSPEVATEVTARLTVLPTSLAQEGSPVLLAELVVWGPTGERLYSGSLQFWQDDLGGIYQRTDENGNVLLNTAVNVEGIPFVPVPLEPLAETKLPFSTMWGGHTSGPLTSANRSIETGEPGTWASPAGEVFAYPVRVEDEITYLTSYVDFRRDQTLRDEYLLWMSQAKGVVALEIQRQIYSATGRLLASRQLTLDVVRFRL